MAYFLSRLCIILSEDSLVCFKIEHINNHLMKLHLLYASLHSLIHSLSCPLVLPSPALPFAPSFLLLPSLSCIILPLTPPFLVRQTKLRPDDAALSGGSARSQLSHHLQHCVSNGCAAAHPLPSPEREWHLPDECIGGECDGGQLPGCGLVLSLIPSPSLCLSCLYFLVTCLFPFTVICCLVCCIFQPLWNSSWPFVSCVWYIVLGCSWASCMAEIFLVWCIFLASCMKGKGRVLARVRC